MSDKDAPENAAPAADPAAIAVALSGASREKADAFLDDQRRMLHFQMEEMREESPLKLSHLRIRRFGDYAKMALEISIGLLALVLVAGISLMVWNAAHSDGLVIESFSVPPDMASRGLTGQVVASKTLDEMTAIQSVGNASRAAKSFASSWGDDIKVEIPDTGVSIGELYRFLKSWLGRESRISGEIVRTRDGIAITARVSGGGGGFTVTGSESEMDAAIRRLAERIYGQTQPYRYGVYLARQGRSEEALAVFRPLALGGPLQERAWGFSGWASAVPNTDIDLRVKLMSRGLELQPDNPVLLNNFVNVYGQRGRWTKAMSFQERAEQGAGERLIDPAAVPAMRKTAQGRRALFVGDYGEAARLIAEQQNLPRGGLNGNYGGHTIFVNSKAFQMAGVTKATPNPFGGTFDKDAGGELNGRVTDRAGAVLLKAGKWEQFTPAQKEKRVLEGVAFISAKFAQYGLTSVHHNEDGALEAIQEQRLRGNLKHRVSYEVVGDLLEAMIRNGIESGFGDEWVRLGATLEHAVDGSLSERTMAMRQSYIGLPASYHGNLTETQDDLNAWCERVHRAHIQLNCHANGDVAIDRTLTAYERALKLYPRANARPKITHCSQVNHDLIKRMKALDVVPSMFSTYPYYNSDKFHFYGQEVMQHMIAFRTMLDAGIVASAGSDFGPGPFSPLMAIQAMVTRTGWNGETWGASQKITLDEAIKVNSWNGAYNSREERDKGSITTGKLADFVVLAEDLHAIPPDKIKDVKIVRTVVGGKTMHQA